jgi:hypothetical protein
MNPIVELSIILAAITGIGVFLMKTTKLVRHIVRFLDSFLGTPENPGVLDRLNEMEKDIKHIKSEVTYNSGTSLKDAVKRIEDRLDQMPK